MNDSEVPKDPDGAGFFRGLRTRLVALAILIWSLATLIAFLVCVAFVWHSHRATWSVRRFFSRRWAVGLARLVDLRVRAEGAPPKPPYLLVCNHIGWTDILALGSRLGCTFVAMAQIADWPIFGLASRSAGVIFIRRGVRQDAVRVGQEISEAFDQGAGVVLFAEGGTSAGELVPEFKSAVFAIPAREQIPVHCAAITYSAPPSDTPLKDWVPWINNAPFFEHATRLIAHSGLIATIRFAEEPVHASDRKVLAKSAHEKVTRAFVPLDET